MIFEQKATQLKGIRESDWLSTIGLSGLLVLFPGFALYHYAIALQIIPPIFDGLYGYASLAIIAIVSPALIVRLLLHEVTVASKIIYITLGYYTTWTIGGYFIIRTENYAQAALTETVSTLVHWGALIGAASLANIRDKFARKCFTIACVGLVLMCLHASTSVGTVTGIYSIFSGTSDSLERGSAKVTYQGIGRSIMVTFLIRSLICTRLLPKILLLTVGSILLILLQARTEFFGVLMVIIVILVLSFFQKNNRGVATLALLLVGVAGYYSWSIFNESRYAEVRHISEASSWQMRLALSEEALQVIAGNPLFGSFGYHHKITGDGGYAHNILSAWTQFGPIGFIIMAGLNGYFAIRSFMRAQASNVDTLEWWIAFHFSILSLFLLSTTVPVFSPMPVISWGFYAKAAGSSEMQVVKIRKTKNR